MIGPGTQSPRAVVADSTTGKDMNTFDRWYLWMIVKSWDMPYHDVVPLLDRLGIEVHQEPNGKQYVFKSDFRVFLDAL